MKNANQENDYRIYKKFTQPVRSLIFWGFNSKEEPSFLILYGTQEFEEEDEEIGNILSEDVEYKTYIISDGYNGHLPSFIKGFIPDDDILKVYKKEYKTSYYYLNENKTLIPNQFNLEEDEYIEIPYFEEYSYEELVDIILDSGIDFNGFNFVRNPNEILNLGEDLKDYYGKVCALMCNKNINTRKNILKELLSEDINSSLFDILFKVGSVELLSGIFLESGKRGIPNFKDKANEILNNYSSYAYQNEGLRRCATIYLNSFLEREEKVKILEEKFNIINKDLQYYYFGNKVLIEVKDIVQSVDVFDIPEFIGKVAYFLDNSVTLMKFRSNTNIRALNYFKKYIRRVIFDYAKNDEEKFMKAVKTLFSMYTEYDYVIQYTKHLQNNYFIRKILYFSCDLKVPTFDDYRNYSVYYTKINEFLETDQLMLLEDRYEFMPELWDRNIEAVSEILLDVKLPAISKALYFILKENEKFDEIVSKMSFKDVIKLACNNYNVIAEEFFEVLKQKIENSKEFDSNNLIEILNSGNSKTIDLANYYIEKTNIHISCEDLVNFMYSLDLNKYQEFIANNIKNLETKQYENFVKELVNNNDKFLNEVPNYLKDELYLLATNIENLPYDEKSQLLKTTLKTVIEKGDLAEFIATFLEQIIFSYENSDLRLILKDFEFEGYKLDGKQNMIVNLLKSVVCNTMLNNSAIIYILENADSKTLKALNSFLDENMEVLAKEYTTMLLLLESPVLSLNQIVKNIFENSDDDKKLEMLSFIIDSPVDSAYGFALEKIKENYTKIPTELILKMMEHTSEEVKGFIVNKYKNVLESFAKGDEDLFIYYINTLLLLPNKVRKTKTNIYDAIYNFVLRYKNDYKTVDEIENGFSSIEDLLFEMGSSNIIKDREEALVTLAKIKMYKSLLIEEVSRCK